MPYNAQMRNVEYLCDDPCRVVRIIFNQHFDEIIINNCRSGGTFLIFQTICFSRKKVTFRHFFLCRIGISPLDELRWCVWHFPSRWVRLACCNILKLQSEYKMHIFTNDSYQLHNYCMLSCFNLFNAKAWLALESKFYTTVS